MGEPRILAGFAGDSEYAGHQLVWHEGFGFAWGTGQPMPFADIDSFDRSGFLVWQSPEVRDWVRGQLAWFAFDQGLYSKALSDAEGDIAEQARDEGDWDSTDWELARADIFADCDVFSLVYRGEFGKAEQALLVAERASVDAVAYAAALGDLWTLYSDSLDRGCVCKGLMDYYLELLLRVVERDYSSLVEPAKRELAARLQYEAEPRRSRLAAQLAQVRFPLEVGTVLAAVKRKAAAGEFEDAIALCHRASGLGLDDGTKTGYMGRAARLERLAAKSGA